MLSLRVAVSSATNPILRTELQTYIIIKELLLLLQV